MRYDVQSNSLKLSGIGGTWAIDQKCQWTLQKTYGEKIELVKAAIICMSGCISLLPFFMSVEMNSTEIWLEGQMQVIHFPS